MHVDAAPCGPHPVAMKPIAKSDQSASGIRAVVTATLSVRNWAGAMDFYKAAFGAVELYRATQGSSYVVRATRG